MSFWNALSVLAPVAPAMSDAQDIRLARQQQAQALAQQAAAFPKEQALRDAQLTAQNLVAQEEQQRIRAGTQPIFKPGSEPEFNPLKGTYTQPAWNPDKGAYEDIVVPGVSPEETEKFQLDSLKKNRQAVKEMMPNASSDQQDYIAELLSGVKAAEPRATPLRTSSTVIPDADHPGMGTKITYDALNGQIYSKEPTLLPRGYQATQTDSWRYDPMLGVMVNSGSTRTPVIPGVSPPAAPRGSASAVPRPPGTSSSAAPAGSNRIPGNGASSPRGAVASNSQVSSAPDAPPSILRYPSMSPQINKVADSMASLQQQFVGDGNDPLWGYADLMDNPQLRQAINLALTTSMNPTPQTEGNAGLGASLATITGLTNWAQKINNQNAVNARNRVQQLGGDRALDFVDRLAELKGSIPTLRAITGASAAQGSIAPLIQESPVLNASGSQDFRKRTAFTLRTLGSALRANPAINPAYSQWLFRQADAADPSKHGMVTVQIPGHPPGQIPLSSLAKFRHDNPTAQVTQ